MTIDHEKLRAAFDAGAKHAGNAIAEVMLDKDPERADDAFAAFLAALPQQASAEPVAENKCSRCAGNGEVVTDWDEYLHPPEGSDGDHATEACQICNGTGRATPEAPAEPVAWAEIFKSGRVASIRLTRDQWRTTPLYAAQQAPAEAREVLTEIKVWVCIGDDDNYDTGDHWLVGVYLSEAEAKEAGEADEAKPHYRDRGYSVHEFSLLVPPALAASKERKS